MTELHGTMMGGHSGVYRTLARIRLRFLWIGMTKDVRAFIRSCSVCQQVKVPSTKPGGLLQPLPIPMAIWDDISMDFIIGLPSVAGKAVIVVVIDRLSKYCHLGALPISYTGAGVAEFFVQKIVRLHGIPKSITSDWDKIFMSKFWKELFRLSGTTLNMASAYHPETDGHTEITNRTIEQYLRASVHHQPRT